MTDAEAGAAAPTAASPGSIEFRRLKAAARDKLFGESAAPFKISRYTILRQLGVGGMGEVLLGEDAELGRKVAIKLVRLDREAGVERASSRLLREAQALARLSHPNVVQVYEVGSFEGRVFIAMEFIRGVHMRTFIEAAPRPWREILDLYVQAGQGLAAAHRVGLVHRDFKPENVLVGDDRRVRVVDFGLVRRSPEGPEVEPQASVEELERSSRLTQSGAVMGTPSYMSPEQLHRQPATAKSDQFAFCVALYRGLYGWHPFAAEDHDELRRRVLSGQLSPPPRDTKVPPALFEVIARGLHPDPDQRYPTMEALLVALAAPPRRRLRVALATASAGLAGALLAWFAWPEETASCAVPTSAWGHTTREALALAFTREGASLVADHAAARLDAYAAELRAEAEAACAEADRPALACLARRARDLDLLTAALDEAGPRLTERALGAIESLPSPLACRKGAGLSRSRDPQASGDREAAQLGDHARIHELRGQHDAAAAAARRALELATRGGSDDLVVEARATLARASLASGDYERGSAALLDVVDLAEGRRDDELAADLWRTLARHALAAEDLTTGVWAARRTLAAAVRLGDEPARGAAELLLGELLLGQRNFSRAEATLRAALVRLDTRPLARARALLMLARALGAQGQHREGDALAQQGLTLSREIPRAPDLGLGLEVLAELSEQQGQTGEARARLRDALAEHLSRSGRGPDAARVHLELARLSEQAGDLDDARAHAQAVVDLDRAAPGTIPDAALQRAHTRLRPALRGSGAP